MTDTQQTNLLVHEKSPYLLQHADNPVAWYPWGEAAFEKARQEDKPIFLSIGYSTCHWCHVMAHESFENAEVAELLNKDFVSIKVDREERPDVDHLYMQAVMQMTGRGGWPMSVFLTPELKPFYGGTYFPPEDRYGQPGFKSVLRGIAAAWQDKRSDIEQSATAMIQTLQAQENIAQKESAEWPLNLREQAYRQYDAAFDTEWAGFNPAPKFPRPPVLNWLLRYAQVKPESNALSMVECTLEAMAKGGMYDWVGGGFHRYSVDGQWRVPHFEKMLYDQALLVQAYTEAYQVTHKPFYAQIIRETLDYVLRDMTDPQGGFYSAEDADSADPDHPDHKVEGAFYVWKAQEIAELIGPERYERFAPFFGVQDDGNALADPMQEFVGKNILYQASNIKEAVQEWGISEETFVAELATIRKILFEARLKKPRPHLDDKILTDWNGLMLGAFAKAGVVLDEPRYVEAAKQSADFILKTLVREDGRLLHRYRDGDAAILGQLEDYAFLIAGLLDLYEATFEVRYLKKAVELNAAMQALFWDAEKSGFFLTAKDAEHLLVRQKEVYDGAIPSGNSVAALNLLKLSRLTGKTDLAAQAEALFASFSALALQNPTAYPQLFVAWAYALGPSTEIVIASQQDAALQPWVRVIQDHFLPNKIVVWHNVDTPQALQEINPVLAEHRLQENQTTVYVCEQYACLEPVTNVETLGKQLEEKR